MVHKKPRCFDPLSSAAQCRQAELHRGRDAKAALESAKSADPQPANAAARRVLAGYSTLGTVRIALCLFPGMRVPQIPMPCREWRINCYTGPGEPPLRFQPHPVRTGRFQMPQRRISLRAQPAFTAQWDGWCTSASGLVAVMRVPTRTLFPLRRQVHGVQTPTGILTSSTPDSLDSHIPQGYQGRSPWLVGPARSRCPAFQIAGRVVEK